MAFSFKDLDSHKDRDKHRIKLVSTMRARCGLPLLPVGDYPWKEQARKDGRWLPHLDRLIQWALALRYRACPNCRTEKSDYQSHRHDRGTRYNSFGMRSLRPRPRRDLSSPSVGRCVVHPSHSFVHASFFLIVCTQSQACIPLCRLSLLSLRSFYPLYAPTVNAATPSTPLSTLI